jgi:hypothetical protein
MKSRMSRTTGVRSMAKKSSKKKISRKCCSNLVFFTCKINVGIRIANIFIWKYQRLLKSNVHISFLKLVVMVKNVKKIIRIVIKKIIYKNICRLGKFSWRKNTCKVNLRIRLRI